jgi:hypothetical protein
MLYLFAKILLNCVVVEMLLYYVEFFIPIVFDFLVDLLFVEDKLIFAALEFQGADR